MECLEIISWLIKNSLTVGCILIAISLISYSLTLIEEKGKVTRKEGKIKDVVLQREELMLYQENLKYSNEILDAIGLHITIAVYKKIQELESTTERYNVLQLNHDIEKISMDVFKSLNGKVYEKISMTYEEDYIMKFIVCTVRTQMIEKITALNNVIDQKR